MQIIRRCQRVEMQELVYRSSGKAGIGQMILGLVNRSAT